MPQTATLQRAPKEIPSGTERCVACGLCLPVCPTYRLTQDEAESPRGRIALMRALAQSSLVPSTKLEQHLQHCLVCRACEKACPSYVPYGQLIDAARALAIARRPTTYAGVPVLKFLGWLISNPGHLFRAGRLLYYYQRSGMQRLLRASGLLRLTGIGKLDALLPPLVAPRQLHSFYPAQGIQKGGVSLFIGCIAQIADLKTHEAAFRLLSALGYDVHIPAQQTCCGALHLHAGDTETAKRLMRRNFEAFGDGTETVLTTASGCGALLHEYSMHLETSSATAFGTRVMDISEFLARTDWSHLSLRPLPQRIAVHDPCTLANVLRREKAPYALLKMIPQAEIVPLPENSLCCGGAGAYSLTQPKMAERLRAAKIRQLEHVKPDILATSNIGCALHLAAGLRETGLNIEVVHPVVLIERQLQVESSK
ncbi:MAG TPA: (Fe-S)-binding protein [Burkholderiales bacterium]|nr:(Fe-S)-binding protein [Burkholderiales bacterium]